MHPALAPGLQAQLEAQLGRVIRAEVQVAGHGARAFDVVTGNGRFFVKVGAGRAGQQIHAEAAGIRALAACSPLVASVRMTETVGSDVMLVLDWVEVERSTPRSEAQLGEGLAELHRRSTAHGVAYGFASDNFIGATPQRNTFTTSWPAFFHAHRLAPQVALAHQNGYWQPQWTARLERLYSRLGDILPAQPPPSLLHGDLWSGNVLHSRTGPPVLIDPAVYHGDREADLAMTRLFGGLGRAFYEAYEATWPLEARAAERVDLYNLYHLLNHLNLFGNGYAGIVERMLGQIA